MTPSPGSTVEDLGRAIKLKFAGQYDDLPDADLGRAIQAKHPGAYDDFGAQPPPPAPAAPPSGPQIILPEQEPPSTPRPPMTVGPVLRRVPGTSTYRSDRKSLDVPGSKPQGEKMPGATFSGPQTPEDMSPGTLAGNLADTPLVTPWDFSGKGIDNAAGYAMDAGNAGIQAVGGMTTPKNIAIMAATMGLSAVPGILAKLGSAGISAYFATEAGKQALEQFPELRHHAEQGDWHAVAANAGAIAANVGMAAMAGKHAIGEVRGAADMSGQRALQEPAKPNQVQRVSPDTPNPPTAATATTPESPETIAVQVEQLGGGQRRVVMFPKGEGQPSVLPEGTAITHDAFGNTYAYRPDLIKKSEIHAAAKNNTLPELLGGPEGMGAPDKADLQGEPVTVVARTPEGVEAQSTATDASSLPETLRATQQVTPPGGTVGIEPVGAVVAERAGESPDMSAPADIPEEAPPEPQPSGPVYMGSLFGGLHQAWDSTAQMFHESAAEVRAMNEKRVQARAEIERAKGTPGEVNFGQKLREFFTGERDFWGARVNQLVENVRRIIPDHVDQQALSLYRDFKNRPGELQDFLDGTHPDFQDPAAQARIEKLRPVIERALNPTPGLLQADQALTTLAAASLSEGQKLGFLDSSMTPEEYVKHMLNPRDTLLDAKGEPIPTAYSGMKDFGRAMGGKIGRGLDSAAKRNYPTLLHAIGEGLAPKTLNALDAMTIYGDKFATARATHLFIDQLRDLGVGKWGRRAHRGLARRRDGEACDRQLVLRRNPDPRSEIRPPRVALRTDERRGLRRSDRKSEDEPETLRRAALRRVHRGAAFSSPWTDRPRPWRPRGGGNRARHSGRDHRRAIRRHRQLDARGACLTRLSSLLRDALRVTPETPGLLTVPAGSHRAPPARVVLRAVVEGPAANLGAAQLQLRPMLVFHRRVQGGDDAPHRRDDTSDLGFQAGLSISAEAHSQPAGSRRPVQRGDVDRVDPQAGVGADQRADCLAQGDSVPQVGSVDGLRGVHQAFCNQPGPERAWVGELLGPVLEVGRVHERLHQPDVAQRGLTVSHGFNIS